MQNVFSSTFSWLGEKFGMTSSTDLPTVITTDNATTPTAGALASVFTGTKRSHENQENVRRVIARTNILTAASSAGGILQNLSLAPKDTNVNKAASLTPSVEASGNEDEDRKPAALPSIAAKDTNVNKAASFAPSVEASGNKDEDRKPAALPSTSKDTNHKESEAPSPSTEQSAAPVSAKDDSDDEEDDTEEEEEEEDTEEEEQELTALPEDVKTCLETNGLRHPDVVKNWTSQLVLQYLAFPIVIVYLPIVSVIQALSDNTGGGFGPFGGAPFSLLINFDRVANLDPWMEFDRFSPFYRHRRFPYKKFNATYASRWFNNTLDEIVRNHILMRLEAVAIILLSKGMPHDLIRQWSVALIDEELYGITYRTTRAGWSFEPDATNYKIDRWSMFNMRNLIYWCLCDFRRTECPTNFKDTLELFFNKQFTAMTTCKVGNGRYDELLNYYVQPDEWPLMNLTDKGAEFYFNYAS